MRIALTRCGGFRVWLGAVAGGLCGRVPRQLGGCGFGPARFMCGASLYSQAPLCASGLFRCRLGRFSILVRYCGSAGRSGSSGSAFLPCLHSALPPPPLPPLGGEGLDERNGSFLEAAARRAAGVRKEPWQQAPRTAPVCLALSFVFPPSIPTDRIAALQRRRPSRLSPRLSPRRSPRQSPWSCSRRHSRARQ